LSNTRLQVVLVIHCNHARELQQSEQSRLAALRDSGISLLNQSVLLRGVNDNAEDLIALSKRLFACHTLPYYLHMLDPTRGAMHFDVDTERALDIHRCLTDRLPGYLVPRLVREQPGMSSKTAISRI
jgi:L-lysine 2,3-aminomutase